MATDQEHPHDIVARALAGNPASCVDISIELLQKLANALSALIGEDGFESLLYRAVRRVSNEFPWLAFDPRSRPADPEFELVRQCLAAQDPLEVQAASLLLFSTLIDILTSLIGAHMTTLILSNALGGAGAGTNSMEQHDD